MGTHPSREIFIYKTRVEVHTLLLSANLNYYLGSLEDGFSFVAQIPLRSQESLFTDLLLLGLLVQSFSPLILQLLIS